ncbi:hypothetical protein [Brevibacillus reuszeri]|uniref:hypothetical protein n=1 Tax=Brevibacillus reuszeri TaxID=54915 RepID=UPI000CCC2F95|nr:hypothetical protein [Brevibacillus reuszeri]
MMTVSEKIMEVLAKESTNLLTSIAAINEVKEALSAEFITRLGDAEIHREVERERLKKIHLERGVSTINDSSAGEILYGAVETDERGCVYPIYVWANNQEEADMLITAVSPEWSWLGEVDEDGEFVHF